MSNYIIVSDKSLDLSPEVNHVVISPNDFIRNTSSYTFPNSRKRTKVINLCNKFDYLSKGYYVSLLAEARGLLCTPTVSTIVSLNWKRNYQSAIPELNDLLKKYFAEAETDPIVRTYTTFFGRHENTLLEPITRRLFDLFRFPVLIFSIKYSPDKKQWVIDSIDTGSIGSLSESRTKDFQTSLEKFTGSIWRNQSTNKKNERYWIAILHDPQEKIPPSNKAALNKFIKIGKQQNLSIELITKQDFSSLLEYDALFIRETTAINNHTYRFAAKAAQEGIPCIDDTQSIIRCCNKVFLHELLQKNKVPTPKTMIIDRQQKLNTLDTKTFPIVLKIPDGAFSRGMYKATNSDELSTYASEMLKKSEIILAQEFVESSFDWRIGVLGGVPLFASQYFMANGHWQIYNHSAKKKDDASGYAKSFKLEDVPNEIINTALKAANLIGNGLYGVDLKQTKSGDVVVIEVNDNPSVDAGVEDLYYGDLIYKKILDHLTSNIKKL